MLKAFQMLNSRQTAELGALHRERRELLTQLDDATTPLAQTPGANALSKVQEKAFAGELTAHPETALPEAPTTGS